MSDPVRETGAPEGEPLGTGDLKAAIVERLERSAGWLRDPSLDPAWVVHEVRKDLKRVRALLRLVKKAAPTRDIERECAGAARQLSALRDADALLETLERLSLRASDGNQARAVASIRERLESQRGSFAGQTGLPGDVAGHVADALEHSAARVGEMSFDAVNDRVLDKGLEKSRSGAARAWRRVSSRPAAQRMHELRKAVKRELYQRELSGRPFDRMDRAMLKKLADVLGEIQDLEILKQALKAERAWHGPLRGLAKQTRRELEQRAARLAGARYGEAGG